MYKLFGIPTRNEDMVDKFANEVSKKGYDEVTASLAERNPEKGFVYICQGILEARDLSLKLTPHFGFRASEFGDLNSRIEINKASRDALQDLIKSDEQLKRYGLKLEFKGGYSLDQMRGAIVLIDEGIQSLRDMKKRPQNKD